MNYLVWIDEWWEFLYVLCLCYIVNFWNGVVVNIELIIWDYLMSGEFRWYYLIKYMYIIFWYNV